MSPRGQEISGACEMGAIEVTTPKIPLEKVFFDRLVPGWNQYRTPITGYYRCGSATHPGRGVMRGPGKLAAKPILSDQSTQETISATMMQS